MIPVWEAGKTYVPGALVRPATATSPTTSPVQNGGFEAGATGWDFPPGWSVVSDKNYTGTKSAKFLSNGVASLTNTQRVAVIPGQAITASVMVSLDHIAAKQSSGRILILWFDGANNLVSYNAGPLIDQARDGVWQKSEVTGSAPAGAVSAATGISAHSDDGGFARFDAVTWNYTYAGPTTGLIFKAVQDGPGKSGASEPVWPTVNGVTVIDNEVVWESVQASRLVWEASALLKSGDTEPAWPTALGGNVADGSINWEAITPRITDPNCPQSKIVAIAASKIYAGDDDIIRFSATVNPQDWTTKNDAGYLPYGLQTYGSNPVAALGLYRSNLAAFNAEGFQMWQVDEDPASIALLDALPVGSTQHLALSPVANDLFFLASQGVRTMGIAAGSTNLKAGDVGIPIDQLVQEAINVGMVVPVATYVPSLGQYWLAFSNYNPNNVLLRLQGTLAAGAIGQAYSSGLTALGGTPPYVQWEITQGSLPAGLTINSATGIISGAPTA